MNIKKTAISLILVIALFFSASAATLAWLSMGGHKEAPEVGGGILGGFFHSGDGNTKETAYTLTTATHVYNLAWLQYLGEFNKDIDNDGSIDQVYFEVLNDIDLGGLIIPPIGTREYPFLGNFNGGGHCLSNFTVSNYVGGEAGIENRPSTVVNLDSVNDQTITDNVSIVGFFGVVGALNGVSYSLDPGIEAETDSLTKENLVTNSIYDLVLDDFSIRTESDSSLIGLVAGYVNGTVSNVGVGVSELFVGKNTAPFTDLGTFTGYSGTEAGQINDLNAYSIFSLVGAAYKDVKWSQLDTLPGDSTLGGILGGGTVPSEGAGFGESMDMYDLTRRLTYIFSENVANNSNYPAVMYYGGTRATAAAKKTYQPDYTYTSTRTSYLAQGTIIPLNVDTYTMFAGTDTNNTLDGVNFLTNNYYHSHTSELILDTNTGYIIGGGLNSGALIRLRINKLASGSQYGGIFHSLGTAQNATAKFVVDDTAESDSRNIIQFLTIDPSGNTYVIDDDYKTTSSTTVNSYTHKTYSELLLSQYGDVTESFYKTLQSGNGMVYGMRFFNGQNITSTTNKDDLNITVGNNVKIAGKAYSSYEFLDGAINFNLSGAGYITAVAGTFALQENTTKPEMHTHHMFTLYKIERDSNGVIDLSSSYAIDKVWVKYASNGKTVTSIKYNNEVSESDGYVTAFDSSKMKNMTQANAAYYFEIPVIEGDYALTSKSGEDGAYLLYLDIGSSGDVVLGEGGDSSDDGNQGSGDIVHAISGVNFVKNGTTSTSDPLAVFRVQQKSASDDKTESVWYSRASAATMNYKVSDSNRFTVTAYVSNGVTATANE